MIYLHS